MKRRYLIVFAVLVVATVTTVGVAVLHLRPAAAMTVALAVASVKAALVALFFMHLARERRVISALVLLAGFLLVALIGLVVLTDRTQVVRPDVRAIQRTTGTP